MKDADWEFAINEEELKEGIPTSVKVGKRNVLLARIEGNIYATGGRCPHYGAPLKDGVLIDHVLTCPWHNARFDVASGEMKSPPALDDIARYVTKVVDDKVFVKKAEPLHREEDLSTKEMTFVIIGAGAAGNAAAITLRREGFCGKIIMLTSESELPYDRPNLSKDYLSGQAEREWIPLQSEQYYADQGIDILKNHEVSGLDIDKQRVLVANGKEISYDKLLLATGGVPRTLNIQGVDLAGFFLLRTLADAEAIIEAAKKSQGAVVLGASFIGLEVAASLRARGIRVDVVAPESVPMERIFGKRVGEVIKRLHEEKGVRFHLGNTARKIEGNGRVQRVVLTDGESLSCDMIVAGLGIVPAVDFLQGGGFIENGVVPVDARLRTKENGIFAAGDIALVADRLGGERRRVEHWVEAERQGMFAARSMMGTDEVYEEVPFFWTKQYDTAIKYIGSARDYDEVVYRGDVEGKSFCAGYYQNGRLKAVSGAGRGKELIVLGEILKAGIDVPADKFQNEELDLMKILLEEKE